MSELRWAPNSFPAPVVVKNPLCPKRDWDLRTHLNEEIHHRCHHDAPVVTLPPFFVFKYLEPYPTYFGLEHICSRCTDGSELQVWDCLDDRRGTAVAG